VARFGVRTLEAAQRLPGGERAVSALPVGGALTMRRFVAVASRVRRSGAVYLAAINGACGGGGLELALSFDLRVAAESAVLLLPELLIGLTTSVGGQRLAELVGPARALEMALEGRPLDAAQALAAGLVNEVVPADSLLDAVGERARRYASRNRATVAAQKRILFEHARRSPAESLRHEAGASLAATTSRGTRRALRAFVQAQRRAGGESPFLADLEPWAHGTAVDFDG
jgi:enoyl-CoA hydratase/carnithine racemase